MLRQVGRGGGVSRGRCCALELHAPRSVGEAELHEMFELSAAAASVFASSLLEGAREVARQARRNYNVVCHALFVYKRRAHVLTIGSGKFGGNFADPKLARRLRWVRNVAVGRRLCRLFAEDRQMPRRLLKLDAVRDLTALRTTSVYRAVKLGTLPPPIKLTSRSSAWVEDEIAACNEARIAGKSDEDLKRLVARLVAKRQQAAAA